MTLPYLLNLRMLGGIVIPPLVPGQHVTIQRDPPDVFGGLHATISIDADTLGGPHTTVQL